MNTVSVTEFVRAFAEYINRVAYRGESFVLVRGKKELAEVRPAVHGRRLAELPKALGNLPRLEPGDDAVWSAELSAARSSLPPERGAWGS
jgi:hypothetical protein